MHSKHTASLLLLTLMLVFFNPTSIINAYAEGYAIIEITERAGVDLTHYAVKIVLNETSFPVINQLTDCNSIYFTDANGNPLYYWIEKCDLANMEIIVWVNVTIPANTTIKIYMHYGGTNPYNSYNDPSQVFLLYDDFDVKDTDKWNWSADWTVENGYAKQTYSDGWPPSGSLWSLGDLGISVSQSLGVVIEVYAKNLGTAYAYDMLICFDDDTYSGNGDAYVTVAVGKYDRWHWFGTEPSWIDWGEPDERNWHLYQVIVFDGKQRFLMDGVQYSTYKGNIAKIARIGVRSKGQSYWDWVRVRPYVEPEPTVTIILPKSLVASFICVVDYGDAFILSGSSLVHVSHYYTDIPYISLINMSGAHVLVYDQYIPVVDTTLVSNEEFIGLADLPRKALVYYDFSNDVLTIYLYAKEETVTVPSVTTPTASITLSAPRIVFVNNTTAVELPEGVREYSHIIAFALGLLFLLVSTSTTAPVMALAFIATLVGASMWGWIRLDAGIIAISVFIVVLMFAISRKST